MNFFKKIDIVSTPSSLEHHTPIMIELGTKIGYAKKLFMDTIIQPVTSRAKPGRYRKHSDEFKRAAVART